MSRRALIELAAGLQDVGGEDGQELPRWFRFQNWRIGPGGSIVRRKGVQRFSRAASNNAAYDLDGSTQYITINKDTRAHTLKRYWTMDTLVKADSFATNAKTIYGVAHASDYSVKMYFTTAGKLEAKVQDSAATVTTLTSSSTFSTATVYAIQLVRDSTALTLRVNGTSEATGTMADLDCLTPGGNLYVGRDNGGLYFDGIIDFHRCLSLVLPDQRYGMIRWPYPYEEYVLWDYEMEPEVSGRVNDRSRFENHALVTGSPTSAAANALCVSSMPVFGMAEWEDRDARTRLFAPTGNGFVLQGLNK